MSCVNIQTHQGILMRNCSKILSQMFTSTPINTSGTQTKGWIKTQWTGLLRMNGYCVLRLKMTQHKNDLMNLKSCCQRKKNDCRLTIIWVKFYIFKCSFVGCKTTSIIQCLRHICRHDNLFNDSSYDESWVRLCFLSKARVDFAASVTMTKAVVLPIRAKKNQ